MTGALLLWLMAGPPIGQDCSLDEHQLGTEGVCAETTYDYPL